MQVNEGSTAAARLYTQTSAAEGVNTPTPETEQQPVPTPPAQGEKVTLSDEGKARLMVDNPGDWPEPPQAP